jgi:hypothetical protein
MADLQVDDLGTNLNIVVGERLGAFGAPYALHGAGLGLAADSNGTDAPRSRSTCHHAAVTH